MGLPERVEGAEADRLRMDFLPLGVDYMAPILKSSDYEEIRRADQNRKDENFFD